MTKRPPGWAPTNVYDDGGPEWVGAAPAFFAERSVSGINPDYGYTCLPWTKGLVKGYGQFAIGGRMMYAHRAVLELKLRRPIKPGMQALHTCDYPACIDSEHLYEGTPKNNSQDMRDRGRATGVAAAREVLRLHPELHARGDQHGTRTHPERVARGDRHWVHLHPDRVQGENNGHATLTEAEALTIREEYAEGGVTRVFLAAKHGISKNIVNDLISWRTWALIGGPPPPAKNRVFADNEVRTIRRRIAAGQS